MRASQLLLGLFPWILFSMIAESLGEGAVGYAALVACFGCLALTVRGALSDGLKMIDVAGVVTFAVLAVVGLFSGDHVRGLLVDYGRGGAALVLAAIMFASVVTVPFTEQYARQVVDRRYWGSPTFRSVNRRLSLLWAQVILAMAAGHLLSGYLSTGNLLLNWVVPVLLVIGAMKRSETIAKEGGLSTETGRSR